jgi:hypothetical protein
VAVRVVGVAGRRWDGVWGVGGEGVAFEGEAFGGVAVGEEERVEGALLGGGEGSVGYAPVGEAWGCGW